jgi:hypothetical protein
VIDLGGASAATCLLIGVFAALATALVGVGWRPRGWHRAGFVAGFVAIGLAVFDNDATARLTGLPAAMLEPARSKTCPPELPAGEAEAAPEPPPPPAEQPGCALVKRAFELGYTDDLGDCAPKRVEAAAPVVVAAREVCTRRQHDEPYLHYAGRKLAGATAALSGANPVDAVSERIDTTRTRLRYLDTLIAHQLHAIGGSPHASHHLWVNLPDPRRGAWLADLLEPPRCDDRYVDLPLWPEAMPPGRLVEHVLGQLVFATRFGDAPGSCRDYAVHWGAPADACERLRAEPARFLESQGALAPVRAVLDRRRRQLELRALAEDLGERATVDEPPPPEQVVSLQCLIVDPSGTARPSGGEVVVDGDRLPVREVRLPEPSSAGAGPIDVYAALAALLAGDAYGGDAADSAARLATPPPLPDELDGAGYMLTRLDRLHDADPFLGVRWPLERAELRDVYPFHRHLGTFVDAFRRRYRAQRGRL